MNAVEFKWALVTGHGCALQYVKEHGDSRPEIRSLLLEACISCPSFDPQVDPRSRWVAEMILYASSPEDYLREIRRHPHLREDRDSTHRAEILFEYHRAIGEFRRLASVLHLPRVVFLGLGA